METNSILSANILDILFDGRNKEYGAYELRKTYPKRIGKSLVVTAVAIILFAIAVAWKKAGNTHIRKPVDVEVNLSEIRDKIIIPPKPILPPTVHVRTVAFVPPLIVEDKYVTKPPLENDKLIGEKIDIKTTEGVVDKDLSGPEVIKGSQVMETIGTKEDLQDKIFLVVEKDAMFQGNWGSYLKKEIEKNMDELTDAGESGTCIVRFVVSIDGRVSDVEAMSMKGTKLAEVAVNAIRRGPRWIPAQQNGSIVNAYRQQPVTFQIND